jgi:hypothetical protein
LVGIVITLPTGIVAPLVLVPKLMAPVPDATDVIVFVSELFGKGTLLLATRVPPELLAASRYTFILFEVSVNSVKLPKINE